MLEMAQGRKIRRGEVLDVSAVVDIRMGTTVVSLAMF